MYIVHSNGVFIKNEEQSIDFKKYYVEESTFIQLYTDKDFRMKVLTAFKKKSIIVEPVCKTKIPGLKQICKKPNQRELELVEFKLPQIPAIGGVV